MTPIHTTEVYWLGTRGWDINQYLQSLDPVSYTIAKKRFPIWILYQAYFRDIDNPEARGFFPQLDWKYALSHAVDTRIPVIIGQIKIRHQRYVHLIDGYNRLYKSYHEQWSHGCIEALLLSPEQTDAIEIGRPWEPEFEAQVLQYLFKS